MHEIGPIKRIQVQQTPLKGGKRPTRYYDPSPLLEVESILLSAKGIIGLTDDGREVIDAHHIDHPESRNVEGKNGISFSFTSHYRSMRERFGDHVTDGIAGENVLVETDAIWQCEDLGEMLALQKHTTGVYFYLTGILVAPPCVEFSQYAANHGMPMLPKELKETLQFLDGGRRGFYATVTNMDDILNIQVGDRLFAVRT
jgi:hypothetical protein